MSCCNSSCDSCSQCSECSSCDSCMVFSQSKMLKGQGLPSPSLGNIGDFYIDTLNGLAYGPKSCLGWGFGTNTSYGSVTLAYSSNNEFIDPSFLFGDEVIFYKPTVIGAFGIIEGETNDYMNFDRNYLAGYALTTPKSGTITALSVNIYIFESRVVLNPGTDFIISLYLYKITQLTDTVTLIYKLPLYKVGPVTENNTIFQIPRLYASSIPNVSVNKGDQISMVVGISGSNLINVVDFNISGQFSGSLLIN